jgi:hypothetical protein
MSSTIGSHVDELEARRKRRETGQPVPGNDQKTPPGSQAAGATRELWRDLIAGAPQDDKNLTAPPETDRSHTATTGETPADAPTRDGARPTVRCDGEGVDELVRRVQAGTHATTTQASAVSRQRRPIGTADLSTDAARRSRAPSRPRRAVTWDRTSLVASKRRLTWVAAASAILLLVGVVLLASFDGTDRNRASTKYGARAASTALVASSVTELHALPRAIVGVVRRIDAAARRTAGSAKYARHASNHSRARSRSGVTPAASAAAAQRTAPVALASTPVATSHTPVYAPAPAATTSQSSSTGSSSSSSSNQPAGPTNAGPLGGIGSCVKGC